MQLLQTAITMVFMSKCDGISGVRLAMADTSFMPAGVMGALQDFVALQ